MTESEVHAYKDFLSQIGPIDTLLGSVSYNEIDNTDGKTQQLRTSARVFKKMKFDLSNSAAAIEKKEKKEEVKVDEVKQEVKKPVNPLWTSEEKDMFFEALNEFGKDFESIHTYISMRLKKKGMQDENLKTKHQIRHFYYKTFHMLCGKLKFNEKIPKNVQELYTLINYGEMRKKGGSLSKKNLSKLGELIANGSIPTRQKGKTIKVKTPMCRALRRLNQLDEKYDDLKLPTRVLVELRPKDMVTFLKIQSMAQNPRIKVALSLQKRLSSLITCINTRWKSSEAVVYDKAVISTNPTTKDCVPDKKIIDENSLLLTPLLRLSPPPEAHVELPSIDISEYFTGQSISLNAFEMRKGVRKKEEIKKEEPDPKSAKPEEISAENPESVNKVINETVNTLLALQAPEPPKCDSKIDVKSNPKDVSSEEKHAKIAQIRQGWTVENCSCLTIGELYLMFGADSKLVLEYSWDPLRIKSQEDEAPKPDNDITNSLKKLLSLAKMHCNKTVMKCPCGHVCGAKPTTFKKPLTSKVVRKAQVNHESTTVDGKIEDSNANHSTQESRSEDQHFLDSNSMVQFFNQRDSMQRRGRGRGRFRQLVVERKLVPNKSETKHQIVTMNIISQENTPKEESLKNSTNSGLPSLLLGEESRFSELLEDNPSSNMSTGISKILKENENQWISSDVADYSLSSLLGHLDCPTKTGDDTQMSVSSQDVDSQLRTLLIENSVDYAENFFDLAAEVGKE